MSPSSLASSGLSARSATTALTAAPSAAWAANIGAVAVRQPVDPRRFLIDFLPAERRLLQRDGLHLFHIRYWSDELRRLMGTPDKVTSEVGEILTGL